jgi:hypothetical protein
MARPPIRPDHGCHHGHRGQVDKDGKFYAISFASLQLKDHANNYSPFLLEAAAAIWGMDHFNEYLKGKKFILYTDHKPLEKLGHIHSKTMNQFQTALLEHDFIIQYKKGYYSTCPRTTYPDFQPPLRRPPSQPSIPSRPTYQTCSERNLTYRIYFTITRITNGQRTFPEPRPAPWLIF